VAETMKEIRKALLDADVNYKTAKAFTDDVRQKALGANVLTSVSPGQLLTKIMNDELTELMGGSTAEISFAGSPTVILIAGLNGAGKTTFTGKLANYLKTQKNKKPLLVADDIYRPAAVEQLQVLGSQIDVPVYANLVLLSRRQTGIT
jgi:signal recognition particle subunit SRP54